jgi:hypothetical protein
MTKYLYNKPLNKMNLLFCSFFCLILFFAFSKCSSFKDNKTPSLTDTLNTYINMDGFRLSVIVKKGKAHNYPLMAVWTEDTSGNYLQSLYVAESIAKGFFDYGESSKGKWKPGPIRRPAALPFWAHKRGVKVDSLYVPSKSHPMPDAVTGSTPLNNFTLKTKIIKDKISSFKVLLEINQSWDWNAYWTNNKYLDDEDYKTSCQPALVYSSPVISVNNPGNTYPLQVIGHSHYSGKNGLLYQDLSTITTALEIIDTAYVVLK